MCIRDRCRDARLGYYMKDALGFTDTMFYDTAVNVGRIRVEEVLINEVYPGPPEDAWVELYNPQTYAVDLTGWRIQVFDGYYGNGPYDYYIPDGTIIEPGGILYFYVDNDGISPTDFVRLRSPNALEDQVALPAEGVPTGYSYGRYPDGADNWIIMDPTPGESNIPEISILLPLTFLPVVIIIFNRWKKNKVIWM